MVEVGRPRRWAAELMSKWPYTESSVIWSIPDEAERFERLLDDVHRAYRDREGLETCHLIEHTIEILGALKAASDGHQGQVWLAAMYLRAAWLDLEQRWKGGRLLDYAAVLDRKRPKSWRAATYRKHRTLGPLVYADISFELSAGRSRRATVNKWANKKYPASATQLDAWYDAHAAQMRSASGGTVPNHISASFIRIAEERKLTILDAITEMVAASHRAFPRASRNGTRVAVTTSGDTVDASVTPSRLPKKFRKSQGRFKRR